MASFDFRYTIICLSMYVKVFKDYLNLCLFAIVLSSYNCVYFLLFSYQTLQGIWTTMTEIHQFYNAYIYSINCWIKRNWKKKKQLCIKTIIWWFYYFVLFYLDLLLYTHINCIFLNLTCNSSHMILCICKMFKLLKNSTWHDVPKKCSVSNLIHLQTFKITL